MNDSPNDFHEPSRRGTATTVPILLFAGLREHFRCDCLAFVWESSLTARELKDALSARHPEAKALILSSRVALGHTFVGEQELLEWRSLREQPLALIPPVSGG